MKIKTKIGFSTVFLMLTQVKSHASVSLPLAMGLSDLTSKLGKALGVMMAFGFIWGVVKIWSGANAISKGDPEGKSAIIGGVLIASAATIMGVLYGLFGMEGAVITPSF